MSLPLAFFSVECRACGWKTGGLSSGATADATLSNHAWVCPKLREIQRRTTVENFTEDGMYVLVETVSSTERGKPLYLERMAPIGPVTTADLDGAQKFESETLARRHPACAFPFTVFAPLRIEVGT